MDTPPEPFNAPGRQGTGVLTTIAGSPMPADSRTLHTANGQG